MKLSPQFGASPKGVHLDRMKQSLNYKGDKFVNQIPTSMDLGFKDW